MFHRPFIAVVSALLTMLPMAPAWAQAATPNQQSAPGTDTPRKQEPLPPTAELEQQSREAYEAGNYVRFYSANMKLHSKHPYVPAYLINVVRAAALVNRPNTAYNFMYVLQQQGLSYDFNQFEDTLNVRDTEAYVYINNLLIDAGKPAGTGSVAFTHKGDPADFASITWDPGRERFLLGTVQQGRLLAVAEDGASEVLIDGGAAGGPWSITGLAVDSGGKKLWLSSSATPRFDGFGAAERPHSALFEYDLESLQQLARYDLPADGIPHAFGSLALTDDGNVYVIDTELPIVYRKAPGASEMEVFVSSPKLVAFTDIAVTPDNSRLFVADPVSGVFLVDPRAQSAAMLSGPKNLNLGGIEGIEYHDGRLFIVQAGISPERVMRLNLDPTGAGVADVAPMAVALDGFDRPGLGTIKDADLYYFANSGSWEEDVDELKVMRTPLDAGNAVKPPTIEDLKRALKSEPE